MNTKKLLALLLALVMVVCVLASCGKKEPELVEDFSEVFSTTYKTEAEAVVSSLAADKTLDGYTVDSSNNSLVILKKTDALLNLSSYKIVSLYSGTVLATLEDSRTDVADGGYTAISYNVTLDNDNPVYKVAKTTTSYSTANGYNGSAGYSLYDATGKAIFSDRAYATTDSFRDFGDSLYVFEGKIYDFDDKTGAMTFKCAYPVGYSVGLLSTTSRNDTYIYTTSGSNNYPIVLNNDFEIVATWTAPSHATGVKWFALDDGNIFIQYSIELPENTNKYDYYESSFVKYDLVTEIFNITDKTSAEVDFDYSLSSGMSYSVAIQNEDAEDIFADNFGNMVTVYPIIDKQISTVASDIDFILMDNEGKLGNSLKLVENQTSVPYLIANDKFMVETTYGYAIVNSAGEVLKQMTSLSINSNNYDLGDYIVNDYGIYDATYELVYDFGAKNAVILNQSGSTLFIREYTGEDYKIIGFKADGTTFDTGVAYDADNKDAASNSKSFEFVLDSNSYRGIDGIYCVSEYSKTTLKTTYKYYNCEGKELFSADNEIDVSTSYEGEGATLLYVQADDGLGGFTYTWYIVKK